MTPKVAPFQHTTFGLVDEDDVAYFGKLYTPKSNIDFPQLTSALVPIPDEDIYPEWMPRNTKLTQAQETFSSDRFIKRPDLPLYDIFQDHNVLRLIQNELMGEMKAMEAMVKHPHPNIVKYHGCRVRRGRITGFVLDWHPDTLPGCLKTNIRSVGTESIMEALESAISHIHSLGWAHNDLDSHKIMVNEQGTPVLVDFGSAREAGAEFRTG